MRPWIGLLAAVAGLAAGACEGPAERTPDGRGAGGGPPSDLAACRDRADRLEAELLEARRALEKVRDDGGKAGAADRFRAVRLRIGGLSTPLPVGDKAAPEQLKLILEPVDAAGDTVKRAGALEVRLEPADQAGAAQTWSLTEAQAAETWLSGVGTYGYVLKLAWPEGVARVRARVSFTPAGGEPLQAEATFRAAAAQ